MSEYDAIKNATTRTCKRIGRTETKRDPHNNFSHLVTSLICSVLPEKRKGKKIISRILLQEHGRYSLISVLKPYLELAVASGKTWLNIFVAHSRLNMLYT